MKVFKMKLIWLDSGRLVLKLVLLLFIFMQVGIAVSIFVIWVFIKDEIAHFSERIEKHERQNQQDTD